MRRAESARLGGSTDTPRRRLPEARASYASAPQRLRPIRVALATLLLALVPALRAQDRPPNVVLITVDDLNTAVGFLSEEPGNPLQTIVPDPEARALLRQRLTPHLDRMAAEGVPFASVHAASPICAPSRAAMLTGVRPHVSRYDGNGDGHFRDVPALASVATLPEYLRENGYYTAGVGKVFHEWRVGLDAGGQIVFDGPDARRSWDDWINRSIGTSGTVNWSPWSVEGSIFRMGTTDAPPHTFPDAINTELIYNTLRFGSGTVLDEAYGVNRSIAPPSDRPFFLALGLYRPHTPLIVPEELLDLFPANGLALTDSLLAVYLDDTADLAPGGQADVFRVGGTILGGPTYEFYRAARLRDPETGAVRAWRDVVRHYLAAVALADRLVGRVMDGLTQGPYASNTVVVVLGDHGWHLGEKTWFGKTTLWEESTSTPLIVWGPGLKAPGQLRRQPVSLMDVYPTVVRMAGLPVPEHVQGADLGPLLESPEADPVSTALTTFDRFDHALRTSLYRYVRFSNDATNVELYDEIGDPDERVNLAPDPILAPLRIQLNEALNRALLRPPPPAHPLATEGRPNGLDLRLAGPNPTRGAAALALTLPASGTVRWEVADALGRVVWRETLGVQPPGEVALRWPGGAASGVYTARVTVDGARVGTQRVVLVR